MNENEYENIEAVTGEAVTGETVTDEAVSEDIAVGQTKRGGRHDDDDYQAPINLGRMVKILWKHKKLLGVVLPVVLVVTYLMTLSVPRYYKCSVELAPESSDQSAAGSLSSIASSFGIDGLDKLGGDDAINPQLYPDLLGSSDFIVTLFPIEVKTKDNLTYLYYDYMDKHQKASWWGRMIGSIQEKMNPHGAAKPYKAGDQIDLRHLSRRQDEVIKNIGNNIKCMIDKKTDAISITVTDQDPEVCTTISDSLLSKIQTFIIDYRTKKARNDFSYYDKLTKEAEKRYLAMKAKYATYADTHQDAVLEAVNAEEESLRDNMSSAYDVFSGMSKMRDQAKAKIQENTPVFTIIQSATLPQKPAGPKRTLISLFVTLLVFLGMSGYLIVKDRP